jgi:hypothetical protein
VDFLQVQPQDIAVLFWHRQSGRQEKQHYDEAQIGLAQAYILQLRCRQQQSPFSVLPLEVLCFALHPLAAEPATQSRIIPWLGYETL